ncbi:MAG TPA: hypothetical protein VFX61_09560 [Micromonosporaceae bacterium]|nr:hypothetical protein [Micromonosporaceae bacterium]
MGQGLQFLAGRLLRSRAGLALLLAAVVLGIVGAARALSKPAAPGPATQPGPLVVTTPAIADDGLLSPEATPSVTALPGVAAPQAVAEEFAAAWLGHTGISPQDWHNRLRPHSTPALAQKLSGVDPAGVPADRITGEPVVIPQAATVAEVILPVDSGELRLRLMVVGDRWLVDGVDWERS